MLKAASSPQLRWSPFIEQSVWIYFDTVGLAFVAFEPEWGIKARVSAGDDHLVLKATGNLRRGSGQEFWTGSAEGAHAI